MTAGDERGPEEERSEDKPFQFTDKRKVDPETAQPRPSGDAAPAEGDPLAGLDFEPSGEAGVDAAVLAAQAETQTERDEKLRWMAEARNISQRKEREVTAARAKGVESVLVALLPVLDDVDRARQHGELTGPFVAIAEKLGATLERLGVEKYGEVGEEFDPTVHEALVHQDDPDATSTTINIVIEPGYRIGERVVRAARVSVVGPE